MSKEKQIEEMAKALNEATFGVNVHTLADHLHPDTINKVAEYLYNAGYRKQSEGEWVEQVRVSKEGKPLLRHYKCNLCGVYLATQANYCPNCGAHMIKEDEGK